MSFGICTASMSYLCGVNKNGSEMDERILPDYLKHIAHAVSLKQPNHYFQLYSHGGFQQYDCGLGNMLKYNQSTPPKYDLNKVKAPIYIYAGGCDMLVSQHDIENLKEILPNVRKYRVLSNYNHCDFNYGKNSRSILFEGILKSMNLERLDKM
jgi:lysosomal acid lipase/cholesteryl ester hydrolase